MVIGAAGSRRGDGPIHGMYGTLEVQRTIKRADLTPFMCLLRKAVGPTMVHVDIKEIIDGQGLEGIDDEEMEELSFIPSALSEPRWALHMCDNECNEEGFKFYQLAAIVVEGGAAHTINLRKQCF